MEEAMRDEALAKLRHLMAGVDKPSEMLALLRAQAILEDGELDPDGEIDDMTLEQATREVLRLLGLADQLSHEATLPPVVE